MSMTEHDVANAYKQLFLDIDGNLSQNAKIVFADLLRSFGLGYLLVPNITGETHKDYMAMGNVAVIAYLIKTLTRINSGNLNYDSEINKIIIEINAILLKEQKQKKDNLK